MIKRQPWFKAAAVLMAACGVAGSAPNGPGYLPITGPPPVRFQTVSAIAPAVELPPLRPPETPVAANSRPTTNALTSSLTAATAATNSARQAFLSTSATAAAPPPAPEGPPAEPVVPFSIPAPYAAQPAAEPVLDPVVLLSRLLSVSTNEPGARIIMPVFVPPAPPSPFPSSHATYESP